MLTFREVEMQDASMILDWRTKPRVASMMMSEVTNDMAPHLSWLKSVYDSKTYYHWIIQSDGRDVGLASINGIDKLRKQTSWGFYIGSDDDLGVGATVPAYVYNLLFTPEWGIEIITAEVLETNPDVLRMHKMYGYVPTPELDHELPDGTRVVTMELSRNKWVSNPKFKNFVAEFPVSKWNEKSSLRD